MIMNNINPWSTILPSSKKRCISGPDIYWYVDDLGFYCLRFENIELGQVNFDNIELNEISINILELSSNIYIVILKLLEPKHYELFYFLSSDIINHLSNDNPIPANKLKNRLLKWIELWKKKYNRELTLIAQMNIFSELYVLFELIVPKKGIEFAVMSWRGPEKDKQDFDLIEYLIEVKSFLSTSKKTLNISSAEQLTTRNQPIKLVAIQLSQNPTNGLSINDLINNHTDKLNALSNENFGLFFSKLYELGYYEEKDATHKFNVVSTISYKVDQEFPVIKSTDIPEGIDKVEYSIKIDSIEKFQSNLNDLVS
jgi:hypothetical protein